MSQRALHLTPRAVPFVFLSIASSFKDLTPKEKRYAHHILQASWCGLPVVARQVSPESLPLLRFFHKVLSAAPSIEAFKKTVLCRNGEVTTQDVEDFLDYAALLYANAGNYLSFGDSKFVPSCPPEAFGAIVESAAVGAGVALEADVLKAVYDLQESKLRLDFPPNGLTAYYSENITADDAAVANAYLISEKINAVNTRVWKGKDGTLTVRIASAVEEKREAVKFMGRFICLHYGDHHQEMRRVVEQLEQARQYAENTTQQRMLDHYVAFFTSGDVEEHKASQKEWVADHDPVVETNLGFVESYRDPSGERAEWEGFVAIVNKKQSCVYRTLVVKAEQFIARLPWGEAFNADTFVSPNFTSLEVLGFASSGIPSGICIPNYDDIRREFGFKNVYLANVVNAISFADKLTHLTEADWQVYKKNYGSAMVLNVGIHELLGHGTGKLFMQKEDGSFNFARDTIDPLTGKPVASWYKPRETYTSVFGKLSSSFEECRAEAVSLYLCGQPELLEIFGLHTPEEQEAAVHVCWLNMIRAGLVGLELYTPDQKQWRQAHTQARYAILQTLVRAPNPIVRISLDDTEGLIVTVAKDRIATDGVKAIGQLLLNLQVNKSLANVTRATEYFRDMTEVSDEYLRYRDIVLAKRKPRKVYVQAHTFVDASTGEVRLEEFAATKEGMLASFVMRHKEIPL